MSIVSFVRGHFQSPKGITHVPSLGWGCPLSFNRLIF